MSQKSKIEFLEGLFSVSDHCELVTCAIPIYQLNYAKGNVQIEKFILILMLFEVKHNCFSIWTII